MNDRALLSIVFHASAFSIVFPLRKLHQFGNNGHLAWPPYVPGMRQKRAWELSGKMEKYWNKSFSKVHVPAMPCQWMFVGWSRDLNWPQCCCCRRGGVLSGVRVRVDLRGDPRRGVSSQGETNTLAPLTRFVHDIRKHDRRRKKHKIQTPFREA